MTFTVKNVGPIKETHISTTSLKPLYLLGAA